MKKTYPLLFSTLLLVTSATSHADNTHTKHQCTPHLGNAFLKHCQQWAQGIEGQRKADLGNGKYLNPIMAGDQYEQWISEYVHEPLCGTDMETYKPTPRLAEKWEISKNGLEFTFFLRKNAFFQNKCFYQLKNYQRW